MAETRGGLYGSFAFWALVTNIIIWLVGAIPFVGLLLAVILVMTRIAFILPHLITLGIILDVFSKRIHAAFLLIPLLVYGTYYGAYFHQQARVERYAQKLRGENAARLVTYNSDIHDLILATDEGRQLLKTYKIPAVYSAGVKSSLISRTVTSDVCDAMRDKGIYTFTTDDTKPRCEFISYHRSRKPTVNVSKARILTMPGTSDKKQIAVSISRPDDNYLKNKPSLNLRIIEQTYRFTLQGKEIGKYVAAFYYRLPLFPAFAFGCSFWPKLDCDAAIFPHSGSRQKIDTIPVSVDRSMYGENPIGVMLGIEKYADEYMSDFKPFPANEAAAREVYSKVYTQLPVLSSKNGLPSYEGEIHTHEMGRSFNDFINNNEGRVVYIDGKLDINVGDPDTDGFRLDAVCSNDERCSGHVHVYRFLNTSGSKWDMAALTVKGYWQVSTQKIRSQDEDTITQLMGISAP